MRALPLLPILLLAAMAAAQSPAPAPAKSAAPAAKLPPLRKQVAERVEAALDAIKTEKDFGAAGRICDALFVELIAFAPAAEGEAFREAAYGVRLVRQVGEAPAGKRLEMLSFLRKNDNLAHTLVFLVRSEDKTRDVYALLEKLRVAHGDDLDRLASLTAAICVVRDQFKTVHVNENTATAADPMAVFEYFLAHERSMVLPPSRLPPELLLSVVNTTSSIDELNWAARRYSGDPKVGQRYAEVKYDMEHFKKGTPKKISELGFTLPNILQYGGVCVDQAYFAVEVGKALGIPTTEVSGRNAGMGHAWMGFTEGKGEMLKWNFETGHYPGYRGVRGNVLNPQINQTVPDSYLSLLAEASLGNAVNRRVAIAMTDAATRLAQIQRESIPFPPTGETFITGRTQARKPTVADRLLLLEAALRRCPTYELGWEAVMNAARNGELTLADKQKWAKILDSLCGPKYPDFTFDVLKPMVDTIEDIKEQDALWNRLFTMFQKRPDIAAEVRFAQGEMWERASDQDKAWDCYQDVISRFANEGPFTVDAAEKCEKLLTDAGKNKDITPMYAELWSKLTKPEDAAPEFLTGSNWYRMGSILADHYEKDGALTQALEVQATLRAGNTRKK